MLSSCLQRSYLSRSHMQETSPSRAQTSAGDTAVADRALLGMVARLYYLEDLPRVDIAERLGISRFKVARLLTRAREEGVVTIAVHDHGLPDPLLSEELRAALDLRECHVVRSHGTRDNVRQQLGAAAADVLSTTLSDDEVLGLTWGRSLTATTSQLTSLPRVTVVQLTGFVSGEMGASPVELVREASQRAGGAVYPIFSPLFVKDAETADSLKQHPDIQQALRLFPQVTTAVVSVGSWNPPVTQVREVLAPDDVAHATALGCVADVAGILVGEDGSLVDPEFQRRTVSISHEELHAVPRVMAVAGGAEKAQAIRAIAKAGLMTSLVTDHALAESALAAIRGE
ncbi:transcriptional regulator [Microbacterium lushaniae]|nr:transcriptional regulator [Microbacterium lushaniae]KAA9153389.1 transcriptional regulator [Microbacterium lushaniae]